MNSEHSFLSKLTLSGYKSVSSEFPQEIPIKDINIVIGANGSG